MSETFITIISIMLVAVLLFAVPLMSTANQNDNITGTTVKTLLSEFVNTSAKEGKITLENYENLIQKLYATGNSYDLQLEVQILSDNPGKDENRKNTIGENIYYSVFSNSIVPEIEKGEYPLKQGDYVKAKVRNTNLTMGTQIKNFVYSIMGGDTTAIEASSSALVTTTK